jgi:transcriptional regulator NrdR family protein
VKKRSGALQSFNKDKLLISIARATDHKENTSQIASDLTQNVIRNLLKNKPLAKILSTKDISNVTSLALKRYDPTSAIKYLSFVNPNQSNKDSKKILT